MQINMNLTKTTDDLREMEYFGSLLPLCSGHKSWSTPYLLFPLCCKMFGSMRAHMYACRHDLFCLKIGTGK